MNVPRVVERAEGSQRSYSDEHQFLTETARDLIDFSTEEDMYRYIGEKVRELSGGSVVITCSFSERENVVHNRAVSGMAKLRERALKSFGKELVEMTFPIGDKAKQLLSKGRLVTASESLYEVTSRSIPEPICTALEKLVGVRETYVIGFIWKEELFGGAIILAQREGKLQNATLIEIFTKQASSLLYALQAKQALVSSARQWQSTFDAIGDPISLLDTKGRVLRCNKAMVNLVPKPFKDIIGEPCWEVLGAGSEPVLRDLLLRVQKRPRRKTAFWKQTDNASALLWIQYEMRLANTLAQFRS